MTKFGTTRASAAAAFLLLLSPLGTTSVSAGTVEVQFTVPVRAQIDLQDRTTVTITPFLVALQEGDAPVEIRGVNLEEEFKRYLRRILRRRTQLKYVDPFPIDYPSRDLEELARDSDFWRVVGERTQADLILSGSLDFDVLDRSGYRSEPFVSPYDGRTYERQVLVEQTGYEYDIVMQVYDGRTGEMLHTDNFKDFKQFEGESVNPVAGMFENLASLEDRIAGVFAQKRVPTSRLLFTD